MSAPSLAPRAVTTAPSLAPRDIITAPSLAPRAGVSEQSSAQTRNAAQIGLHLLLAGLPLLAISAQVFGFVAYPTYSFAIPIALSTTR